MNNQLKEAFRRQSLDPAYYMNELEKLVPELVLCGRIEKFIPSIMSRAIFSITTDTVEIFNSNIVSWCINTEHVTDSHYIDNTMIVLFANDGIIRDMHDSNVIYLNSKSSSMFNSNEHTMIEFLRSYLAFRTHMLLISCNYSIADVFDLIFAATQDNDTCSLGYFIISRVSEDERLIGSSKFEYDVNPKSGMLKNLISKIIVLEDGRTFILNYANMIAYAKFTDGIEDDVERLENICSEIDKSEIFNLEFMYTVLGFNDPIVLTLNSQHLFGEKPLQSFINLFKNYKRSIPFIDITPKWTPTKLSYQMHLQCDGKFGPREYPPINIMLHYWREQPEDQCIGTISYDGNHTITFHKCDPSAGIDFDIDVDNDDLMTRLFSFYGKYGITLAAGIRDLTNQIAKKVNTGNKPDIIESLTKESFPVYDKAVLRNHSGSCEDV